MRAAVLRAARPGSAVVDRRISGPGSGPRLDGVARTFAEALAEGPLVLDGGLATQLEAQGHDLSSSVWSARVLADDPDAVLAAHRAFFAAGAQVATTASYQVSSRGFASVGLDGLAHQPAAAAQRAARPAGRATRSPARPGWRRASARTARRSATARSTAATTG